LFQTFNLNVDGIIQDITFATAADYNNGVIESITPGTGIYPGTTAISVEATGDWQLEIECPDFAPNGNGASGAIPIDNLGVYCVSTGTYTFGNELTCAYTDPASALGLDPVPVLLIGNGSGNAGDISDNSFTLHWEMGTQNGSMHTPETMFDQMISGAFTPGDYTTTATLTLFSLP
jgi:hypothetical protein